MKSTLLRDGLEISCLRRPETLALDEHIEGYFRHGVDVHEGAIVVDIGANIGLFALRAMQRSRGTARVYSVEPVPPIFEVLKTNAARFHPHIEAINAAVGANEGSLPITYFPRSPSLSTAHGHLWDASPGGLAVAVERALETPPQGYEMVSRLLPAWSKSFIARFIVGKQTRFDCPMTTLSSLIASRALPHIDLLKVDVEGAEHDVLRGVADIDWPRIKSVVIEVHDVDGRLDAIRALLAERGLLRQQVEIEAGFSGTHLKNVYATRVQA